MRICSRCKTDLNDSEFYKKKNGKLQAACKRCYHKKSPEYDASEATQEEVAIALGITRQGVSFLERRAFKKIKGHFTKLYGEQDMRAMVSRFGLNPEKIAKPKRPGKR